MKTIEKFDEYTVEKCGTCGCAKKKCKECGKKKCSCPATNEDAINEDSGCAACTAGSGNGMGAIVAPTVSSTPGDVAGSTAGSGDIAAKGATYYQRPARRKNRKKKNENIATMYVKRFGDWEGTGLNEKSEFIDEVDELDAKWSEMGMTSGAEDMYYEMITKHGEENKRKIRKAIEEYYDIVLDLNEAKEVRVGKIDEQEYDVVIRVKGINNADAISNAVKKLREHGKDVVHSVKEVK